MYKRQVVNGAGSAGMAITRLLVSRGLKNVIMCDKYGSLYRGNPEMNSEQAKLAELTNPDNLDVKLDEAIVDADLFIGVSAPGILTEEMVEKMAKDPIVFAMANPVPEIMPDVAKKAGVRVIGTGRSDFPNQINNVLAFPGIFRGALDVRASVINAVSYTHLRAHETDSYLVCRLLLEKKKKKRINVAISTVTSAKT